MTNLDLNKRTGESSKSKPKGYNKDRIEALEFEYFILDDGTEISIHTGEDGIRMCERLCIVIILPSALLSPSPHPPPLTHLWLSPLSL